MQQSSSFGRCPWIRNKLKNGRVRYRYKGRVAKFLCNSGYDLAGKRSATCVRGQWSNPMPVCVARGCPRVPLISNGHVTEMYRGALLVYDCNPGYTLDGVASIHCDGRRWSTSPPVCVVATKNPDMSCDFESAELCGWTHDPNHDFDWKRNQFSTPSGHAGTGPSFDHTFGENKGGYYLYIEASSPRKVNDTARLFSPVYPAGMSGGCFVFWYHMYGATTGGLRVYFKPESHVFDELSPKWEKIGDQGNQWNRGSIPIPALHEDFQIVIEGVRGESYVGDSAIDDVSLTTQDCDSMENDTVVVEHTNSESCRGRCRESRDSESSSSCSCNDYCVYEHNCCSDYATFCYEGNETTVQNTDEPPAVFPVTSPLTIRTTVTTTETSKLPITLWKFSTRKPDVLTSTTSVQTSLNSDSPVSITSSVPSVIPLNITFSPSIVLTSSSLSSTNTENTSIENTPLRQTAIDVITSTSLPESKSSSSSSSNPVETTKSSPAAVRTNTISTSSTSISSTLTSPKHSTATTFTAMIPTKTTRSTTRVTTTLPTTLPTIPTSTVSSTLQRTPSTSGVTTVLPTAQSTSTIRTTLPTTKSSSTTVTTATKIISASTFINYKPLITTASATLIAESTSTPSTTTVSTVSNTTEPSTKRTYDLRPKPHRTNAPVSSPTYPRTERKDDNQNITDSTTVTKTTLPPTTHSKRRTTVYPTPVTTYAVTSSRRMTVRTTTFGNTKETITTSTGRPNTRQTTSRPVIYHRFTSTESPFPDYATSDSYAMATPKSEITSGGSSASIVVPLLVVIICIIAGAAYYMRKQRNKRQSKLSDDSEMRFLQENEYMEYSDASALDKILIK